MTHTWKILSVALLAAGCTEPIKAGDVYTSEIAANMDVVCDGQHSVATTLLTVGGSEPATYIALDVDDTLTTTVGEESLEMSELTIGGIITYIAAFDVTAVDSSFTIAFDHPLDGGALNNTVTLPPPFDLTVADSVTSFSRSAEDLALVWTGDSAGDPMHLHAAGDCIEDYDQDMTDEGTATIPAGALVPVEGLELETCDVTVTVVRVRLGTVDSAWYGGDIEGDQQRAVTISGTP